MEGHVSFTPRPFNLQEITQLHIQQKSSLGPGAGRDILENRKLSCTYRYCNPARTIQPITKSLYPQRCHGATRCWCPFKFLKFSFSFFISFHFTYQSALQQAQSLFQSELST